MRVDNSVKFVVTYDGEALRDHEIDVRDLAPALLAIGKLFDDANQVINGARAEVRVRMKATGEGSFAVVLDLIQGIGQQLYAIAISNPVVTAIALRDLIGVGIGDERVSVLGVLKWLRGRRPKKTAEEGDKITLTVDGESIVVTKKHLALLESVPVRDGIKAMLAPLEKEGITEFKVSETIGATPSFEIKSDCLAYYYPPTNDEKEQVVEQLEDRTWTTAYNIISLTFKEDNKWRLSDGQSPINATILDKKFLAEVDQGRAFAKGDALVCEILQKQAHTPDGIRSEYYVTKVIEFKRAPRQMKMFD